MLGDYTPECGLPGAHETETCGNNFNFLAVYITEKLTLRDHMALCLTPYAMRPDIKSDIAKYNVYSQIQHLYSQIQVLSEVIIANEKIIANAAYRTQADGAIIGGQEAHFEAFYL